FVHVGVFVRIHKTDGPSIRPITFTGTLRVVSAIPLSPLRLSDSRPCCSET
ncbi:Delta-halcutoxin-Hcg1a, partial [Clarias magur]